MSFQPLDILDKWDGGANTRQLNDAIQRNESPYPLNVQFEGQKIAKAPGYTQFGVEADDTLIGFNLYNHRILSNEEVMVKVIGTKVKYYDEVTLTWQILSSTAYTTGKKWWFASFNGYLYGGNDTDSVQRWKLSSWGKLAAGISPGAAAIDLAAGEGARFASSGSGLIEGDSFAWTGISTDQLTGVTGVTSLHSAGARVTIEPVAYASAPKGKIGSFYRNRLYIVSADSPNFIYFSKLADNTNPQDDLVNYTVAGTGSGDAGYIIADAATLELRQYITGGNDPVLVAFCSNGISYACSVSDTGSATTGLIVPFKVTMEDVAGCNLSAVTENDLVFIGKSGAIRAMGYGDTSSTLKTSRLSDEIMPTLTTMDWSDGNMVYFDRRIFISGKINEAEQNNFVIVKDTNPNGFVFWNYYAANMFCEWKDNLYFLSSVGGKVYKMFDGRATDTGIEIASNYPTFSTDFNAPMILKLLSKIRVSGEISVGCTLTVNIYFDEVLQETFDIVGSSTTSGVVTTSTGVAVGTVTFGTNAHGSSDSNVPIRRKFLAEFNTATLKYFFDVYLEYSNNEKDVDFLLDKQMLFAEVADSDLMFANKMI